MSQCLLSPQLQVMPDKGIDFWLAFYLGRCVFEQQNPLTRHSEAISCQLLSRLLDFKMTSQKTELCSLCGIDSFSCCICQQPVLQCLVFTEHKHRGTLIKHQTWGVISAVKQINTGNIGLCTEDSIVIVGIKRMMTELNFQDSNTLPYYSFYFLYFIFMLTHYLDTKTELNLMSVNECNFSSHVKSQFLV